MRTLDGSTLLITGGTGSFGRAFVRTCLEETDLKKIIVFSRDELKQWDMRRSFEDDRRLRFFLGDVRDLSRLERAFDGVDLIVHAAALKQIPAVEYNPFEAVKTNIHGAKNVIDAAIDRGVREVIALSTDKASSPVNLYGATKLVSDKLFVAGNAYAGAKPTRFAVVRYGNVIGSRGSVIPLLRKLSANDTFPMTDERMTRFWITLEQGIHFVMRAFAEMVGGEIFVPKIPSMKITDLLRAIAPQAKVKIVGIRPGEKLHEEMISASDARRTVDRGDHYVICPDIHWWGQKAVEGNPVPEGFQYSSDRNDDWLDHDRLKAVLDE